MSAGADSRRRSSRNAGARDGKAPDPEAPGVQALDTDTLITAAAQAGVHLSASAAEQLQRYAATLLKWNAVHNLTAI
jgi:hypothetical protein